MKIIFLTHWQIILLVLSQNSVNKKKKFNVKQEYENSVIYSPSSCFKPVRISISFFNWLQAIINCVQQKKEILTGLKRVNDDVSFLSGIVAE